VAYWLIVLSKIRRYLVPHRRILILTLGLCRPILTAPAPARRCCSSALCKSSSPPPSRLAAPGRWLSQAAKMRLQIVRDLPKVEECRNLRHLSCPPSCDPSRLIVDYPDGRLAIRYNGIGLTYRTFDKVRQVDQGAIADNRRLGPILAMIRDEQLRRGPERRSGPRRRDQRDARLFNRQRPQQGRI
jgi:hypothetical protein